jgi:tetratricopeptide (TPR) repeat protein
MLRSAGALFLLGCASTAPSVQAPGREGGATVSVPRIVVTPNGTHTLPELFDAGRAAAERGDFRGAANFFDRVAALEPRGELAAEATFLAAEAYDSLHAHAEALKRYQIVVERYPRDPRAPHAAVRGVRLAAYEGEWDWAGRFADRALERWSELGALQQIAVYAGKALESTSHEEDVRASGYVERGRNVVERDGLDLAGRLPIELAPLYYALGEVRRIRAERIHFDAPAEFAPRMEARCQLILDAQSAYSDSWRAYDAHWSLLSGVRVGELYDNLHRELMRTMQPPAAADTDDRRLLYYGATRLLYSVLLEKAHGMLDHTLAMATREREASDWVNRARKTLEGIREAEREEQASLERLPYSRAELEQALRQIRGGLRDKAAEVGKGAPARAARPE